MITRYHCLQHSATITDSPHTRLRVRGDPPISSYYGGRKLAFSHPHDYSASRKFLHLQRDNEILQIVDETTGWFEINQTTGKQQ